MKYSIQELKAELLDQRYNLSYTSPTNWVVDYDDVLTAIANLEKELRQKLVTPLSEIIHHEQLLRKQIKEILGDV